MSARLTKADREQMAKALVRHRFHEQAEALMQESVELFAAVYAERYDAKTQKLMLQLSNLHEGAFSTNTTFTVCVRGMRVVIGAQYVGARRYVMWVPQVVPVPVLHRGQFEDIANVAPVLAEKIADFALRSKAFGDEIGPAYGRALATLNQFTTGKKLSEEWPEAMPVIGNLIPVSERNLPVVQLTAINDEFGLPPSEVEAA